MRTTPDVPERARVQAHPHALTDPLPHFLAAVELSDPGAANLGGWLKADESKSIHVAYKPAHDISLGGVVRCSYLHQRSQEVCVTTLAAA